MLAVILALIIVGGGGRKKVQECLDKHLYFDHCWLLTAHFDFGG
jgi:hypothetical protein